MLFPISLPLYLYLSTVYKILALIFQNFKRSRDLGEHAPQYCRTLTCVMAVLYVQSANQI